MFTLFSRGSLFLTGTLVENNCVKSPAPLVSSLLAFEDLRSKHTTFLRKVGLLEKIPSLLMRQEHTLCFCN